MMWVTMLIDVTTGLPMVRSLRPVTVDDVKAIEEEQSMSVVRQPPPMSFEAYLAWEAEQSERHEFLRGEVFAMTGARATHNTIAGNIFAALKDGLRGTPCRVFIAYMKLHAQIANASFYPDVFVTCDASDRTADAELVQRHPQLVVEVLSDSTAGFDRGEKFEACRSIDTLQAYLLVEQHRVHADPFLRSTDGLWVLHSLGADDAIDLTPLGLSLPVASLYEGVEFGDATAPSNRLPR